MKTRLLDHTANIQNERLAAANIAEKWVYDDDETSNSVGSWFIDNIGGVTTAHDMRSATTDLLERHAKVRAPMN